MYEARRQRSSWARIKLSIVRKFMSITLFQDRSNFIFLVHHSLRINKFISSFAILFSRFNKNWIALLSYYLYFAIYNKNLGFKSFSRRWPDYLIPPAAFWPHQRSIGLLLFDFVSSVSVPFPSPDVYYHTISILKVNTFFLISFTKVKIL